MNKQSLSTRIDELMEVINLQHKEIQVLYKSIKELEQKLGDCKGC